MCLACEEEAMFWRYQLELAVERGEIPEGFEPADFEAAGLPVPGRHAPVRRAVSSASASPVNAFTCDSPDRE
jgi:hypothetical protein